MSCLAHSHVRMVLKNLRFLAGQVSVRTRNPEISFLGVLDVLDHFPVLQPHLAHSTPQQLEAGELIDTLVEALETREDSPTKGDSQFLRLLAEIWAVGLSTDQLESLSQSMDLPVEDVERLFLKAEEIWQRSVESNERSSHHA